MSHAHVCDECKTVAPLGKAITWWRIQAIEAVLAFGDKPEYHFCGWRCIDAYTTRKVSHLKPLEIHDGLGL